MTNLCFHFCVSMSLLLLCLMVCPIICNTTFTTDDSAVLALKFSVTDPHNHLANWSNSSSICDWTGVICDSNDGRVKILKLGGMGLKGALPSQIGNLSFLEELDLHSNSFYGELPKELRKLDKLRILNLSYNQFSGDIPLWIGSLFTLQHLILEKNNLGGVIPLSISNLSKLETLNWRSNFIEGSIPLEIGRLQYLKILRISSNNLSGMIPPSVFNLSSLEQIILSNNSLSGVIPKGISNLTNVKYISLSGNLLSGQLPKGIENLTMLEELYLSYNDLQGSIPKEIGELHNLKTISLGVNEFFGQIPSTIFNISGLQQMDLSQNNLSGSIPSYICHGIPKIQYLSLEFNELSGALPSQWIQCKDLNMFSVASNRFSGHIPREIVNLTMLQELYLPGNVFTGTIPVEIGNLHKLEKLELAMNELSGSIPSIIFNMSTLKLLSLQSNFLSGSLPSNFGSGLPYLEQLYLWGNRLSGRIPKTISNASKLTMMELAYNNFEGALPSTIGHLIYLKTLQLSANDLTIVETSSSENNFLTSLTNCRNLEVLDLSINPLYTKLSKAIGNFSHSLQKMDMHSCKINGNIPSEIGNLTNLIRLSLGENSLTGPLPRTISNLKALQFLNFEGNQLQGLIVDEICEIKRLVYLYLSLNKFSGAMPTCIGNMTSLQKLFVGSNKLISVIPSSFWNLNDILEVNLSSNILVGNLSFKIGNLKALTLLDLSRNNLSSIIPITLGGLQNLQILSLAHNTLQGNIPETFGNLLSLVKLDLSQNNLSGEIPKSLESLVYLKNINLSYNKLHGEIPNGGAFKNLTFESFMMNDALCGQPRLRVPPCRNGIRKGSMTKLILLKIILPIVVSTILVVLGIILWWKRPNSKNDQVERNCSTLGVPRRISYFEIVDATNGFDESNLIGRGSYGSVFKGKLFNGIVVAIKIFNFDSEIMSRSFEVECDTMRNVRHRNLVKIISSCSNIDFKCLIMEFMPKGSLEKWLYSHNYCLDFLERLNIMINVASALEYLHHGLSTPIVHCDLKPSNILLDDNMVGHVSDFGISKLLDEGQSKTHTETIPTIGYVAPEYGSSGVVSTKVDVYSYGIILKEVFTRKKPTDNMFVSGLSLKGWVSVSMPHAIIQVIDSNLLQEDEQHVDHILQATSSIFELALSCCTDIPETRSNMIDVVVSLNKIKAKFMQGQKCHI
ncbi:LRR receptor-like serine/threonine-protein kinase EFR isoform X4 [Prosopis cineraria]|uniref:LRR receptor-like serine/threonine-protein kinase EFR isoform X4 n=1 Tax=Prosopis cineraria TaxID=364024 RepID=UPI00240ED108|nr:LRR receptor-like serine/threonine-protein kinase EFR isoform X4 [Prosopis cineraria]